MALVWLDRTLETTTTTGTGALTLAAAVTGYQRFSAGCSTNDTVYYAIFAVDANGNPSGDWEAGLGTYSGANTLTRTTVSKSSNSNNAVNFAAGTKWVMACPIAAFFAMPFMTGALLTDPNADRIAFWDDSAGAMAWLTLGTNLSITGTTLDAAGGSGTAWQIVFRPYDNEPPTSNYATLDVRNNHPCLDFDTSTQETAIFSGVLPAGYAGGGITVSLHWAATSATSGTIGWDVAIERIGTALDIDSDSFATAQTVTAATVSGTSGILSVTSVSIANGADMDSLAAGESFRIRIRRDVTNDTAAGDAELFKVVVEET